MKKIYLIFSLMIASYAVLVADHHQVSIIGFTYSPDYITVNIGDTVTISASDTHPLVQVSSTTWYEEEDTPLPGGFGPTTSNYTFKITSQDTIFYVCENHVGSGMKGKIAVASGTSINPLPSFHFTIYPNPTPNGKLNVSIAGSEGQNKVMEIYNTVGQLVQAKSFLSETFSSSHNLSEGIYFIVIRKRDFEISKKLIVSR